MPTQPPKKDPNVIFDLPKAYNNTLDFMLIISFLLAIPFFILGIVVNVAVMLPMAIMESIAKATNKQR